VARDYNFAELERLVTPFAMEKLQEQLKQSEEYAVEQVNPTSWKVTNNRTQSNTWSKPWQVKKEARLLEMLPNARIVCDCDFFLSYRIPCRHILALNNGNVLLDDIGIRWMSLLENGYLDDVEKGAWDVYAIFQFKSNRDFAPKI